MKRIEEELQGLATAHRLRRLPKEGNLIDFTSNDYLGLATDLQLQKAFLSFLDKSEPGLLGSGAARLLASRPKAANDLEVSLAGLYNAEALIFNSGYHANVGVLSALGDDKTLILADKLIHASAIDGAGLAKADFKRFPHNNISKLASLLEAESSKYRRILITVEAIYSMDGDSAPLEEICRIKKSFKANGCEIMLYVDEAHSFGICGPGGLGMTEALPGDLKEEVDLRLLTFGKAAGSAGAAVICSEMLKTYLLNKSRSFIFSTALAPVNYLWTKYIVERMANFEPRREKLKKNISQLAAILEEDIKKKPECSHIMPFMIGNAAKALDYSRRLADAGLRVLAIRPPTVPAGTERLRISLSAAHSSEEISRLGDELLKLRHESDSETLSHFRDRV